MYPNCKVCTGESLTAGLTLALIARIVDAKLKLKIRRKRNVFIISIRKHKFVICEACQCCDHCAAEIFCIKGNFTSMSAFATHYTEFNEVIDTVLLSVLLSTCLVGR